jgi:hypothetical protein
MKGGNEMLSEKELRKVAARAFTTLGHGPTRPCDVPAKVVAALQCAIENGGIRLPVSGSNAKVQKALVSGAFGLLALNSASTKTERISAAFQLRKAAALAATA